MKRTYIAPAAEITILAPHESVTTGWKPNQVPSAERWWISKENYYFGSNIPSGTTYWYDFGMNEINDPPSHS